MYTHNLFALNMYAPFAACLTFVYYDYMVIPFSVFLFNQIKEAHPRELNPYLKDNGSGYPDDIDGSKASGEKHLSSSVVGDGGASWRLKALKRAQEQAAREGRRLKEACYLNFQIFSSISMKYFLAVF